MPDFPPHLSCLLSGPIDDRDAASIAADVSERAVTLLPGIAEVERVAPDRSLADIIAGGVRTAGTGGTPRGGSGISPKLIRRLAERSGAHDPMWGLMSGALSDRLEGVDALAEWRAQIGWWPSRHPGQRRLTIEFALRSPSIGAADCKQATVEERESHRLHVGDARPPPAAQQGSRGSHRRPRLRPRMYGRSVGSALFVAAKSPSVMTIEELTGWRNLFAPALAPIRMSDRQQILRRNALRRSGIPPGVHPEEWPV